MKTKQSTKLIYKNKEKIEKGANELLEQLRFLNSWHMHIEREYQFGMEENPLIYYVFDKRGIDVFKIINRQLDQFSYRYRIENCHSKLMLNRAEAKTISKFTILSLPEVKRNFEVMKG